MGSVNHVQPSFKSDTPSPSSGFDTGPAAVNMEITLVNSPEENADNDNGRLPDVVVETKIYNEEKGQIQETYLTIAVQVFIPFLIAGFGMVFAGLALDRIQV